MGKRLSHKYKAGLEKQQGKCLHCNRENTLADLLTGKQGNFHLIAWIFPRTCDERPTAVIT